MFIHYFNNKFYVFRIDKYGNVYDTMHSFKTREAAMKFFRSELLKRK